MRKYLKVFCHKHLKKAKRESFCSQHPTLLHPYLRLTRDVILSHEPHASTNTPRTWISRAASTDARANVNHAQNNEMQTGWSSARWLIITNDDAALSSTARRLRRGKSAENAVGHLFSKETLWNGEVAIATCVKNGLCPYTRGAFVCFCRRVGVIKSVASGCALKNCSENRDANSIDSLHGWVIKMQNVR